MRWLEAPRLELSGLVGTCREFVGTCREFVRTCRDLSGGIGNVDFMESYFEGIAIVVNKILAKFPIPEILRSVPGNFVDKMAFFSCYRPEKGKRTMKKEKERKREKTLVQVTNKIYWNKNDISNLAPTMVNKSIHLL